MGDMISLHEKKDGIEGYSGGLYDECMGYLNSKMLFADELCPMFLASIGCHIANEYQLRSGRAIHSYKGIREDLCLHLAIISPSGFSKGHTFKLFLDRNYGINPFPAKITGKVTEAGYVGTVKETGYIPGLAMKLAHGIVAFNEISNLIITSESKHSGELINQVQESLTERHVNKKLASGEIDFDTYLTLWGGSVMPFSPIIIQKGKGIDVIPICDAQVGTMALTGNGFEKIRSIGRHPWNGTMLGLNLHGSYLDVTPNHSLFKDKKKIEAGRLKIGDKVDMVPKSHLNLPSIEMESSQNPELAFVQGLWCAEGWRKRAWNYYYGSGKGYKAGGYRPSYYICQKESPLLYKAKDIVDKEFGEGKCSIKQYRSEKGGMYFMAFDQSIGGKLFNTCLNKTRDYKKIPFEVLNSDEETKRNFYNGFIAGDGSTEVHGLKNRTEFTQVNRRSPLSLGLCLLNDKFQTVYLDTHKDSNILRFRESEKLRMDLNEVKKIRPYQYHGPVYDIETESNTFLTGVPNLMVAHNSQPGRFDFSGGLGRRLVFITKAWTKEDMILLKTDRKDRKETKVDYSPGLDIRHKLELLRRQFEVERVVFEDKMMEYIFDMGESHLDMGLMEKALIGKNVLNWTGENELKIGFNESNKTFIRLMRDMKQKVSMGSNISLMMNVISDHGSSRADLWNMFRRFGYTFEKFENLLELCMKLNLIGVRVNRTNIGIEKTFFKKNLKVM